MHQITKVSPKKAGSPPRPQRLRAVHFTPNTREMAEQIASMIPRQISGCLLYTSLLADKGDILLADSVILLRRRYNRLYGHLLEA